MMHTIISWDCSYRNFFHLIDGLLAQSFDREKFELIFVEQRTKEYANAWNRKFGLPTLEDRLQRIDSDFNLQVLYLDDPDDTPYHLGRCVNRGLEIARGKYVSVMDGDQLLEQSFLHKLTAFFEDGIGKVVNIHRRSSAYPVGVSGFKDWAIGTFDFDACLAACPEKNETLTTNVGNFGPMVGASADLWRTIEGYDECALWASVLSRAGYDVNVRLELASGTKSRALTNTFAVHPWHPIGGGMLRGEGKARRFFGLQQQVIDWSISNGKSSVSDRLRMEEELISENSTLIDEICRIQNGEMEDLNRYSMSHEISKVRFAQLKTSVKNFWKKLWP
jgi:hypothetical protein